MITNTAQDHELNVQMNVAMEDDEEGEEEK
jgi:hypothetical protein